MSGLPLLLPVPREMRLAKGHFALLDHRVIMLDSDAPHELLFSARRLQAALATHCSLTWEIVEATGVPHTEIGATLSIVPGGAHRAQGYELAIGPEGIRATAATPAGVFYAICTLSQIIESTIGPLPALHIKDWPDFPARGVMLDISRNRVPKLETIRDLIDLLASWKINQLQFYVEHTFAYRFHPEVWAEASPLTGQEVRALDACCRERFIELVPNQNSFGHMERWLQLPRYQFIGELKGSWITPWGEIKQGGFSLCPGDAASIELVRSLYDELLPHFSSRLFNIGGDETFDLGQGRSAKACKTLGRGRVYLDFLLKIYREVQARGRTMQFWDDIIVQYPELIRELPSDIIALEWGYEANHPFDRHGERLEAAGIPFYVCPGTCSWNSLAGRTNNVLGNLRNAAESGLKHGAIGYLNTDWGDSGHWQPLPVSYVGLAYGAAAAWSPDALSSLDFASAVSRYAFGDPTGTLGCIALDLGNVHQETGVALCNSSLLFQLLNTSPESIIRFNGLTEAGLRRALDAIDAVMARWPQGKPMRSDAELIRREYAWVADMMRHACRRGLWALGGAPRPSPVSTELMHDAGRLIIDFRELWLKRSRPGGLAESVALLEKVRRTYREAA